MAEFTPRGLNHPTSDDKIKDGSSPSALADDFKELAVTADAAITAGVQEAKSAAAIDATSKANAAKQGAIDDATTKYGGLPSRVTALELIKLFKGTLPNGSNLNDLSRSTDSGIYQLSSGFTYLNSPVSGASATLIVDATDFSGMQTVIGYASSAKHERFLNDSSIRPRGWGGWARYDVERQRVLDIEAALPDFSKFRGTLPSHTPFSSLRFANNNGSYLLSRSNVYPSMPTPVGTFEGAILTVDTTGFGDTIHTVQFRFDGGRFTSSETSAGVFSPWRRIDKFDWQEHIRQLELIEGRAALAESGTPVEPMIDTSGLWTTFGAGEALIDRMVRRNYPRRTITNPLEVKVLGYSYPSNRQLRAVVHGDPTKPALLIMAGTHGDEVSSREAVLQMLTDRTLEPVMSDRCIIVVPTVNPDGTNVKRVNDLGADLNRTWADTDDRAENRAVKTLFADYDIRAVLDCHEGGNFTETQLAINETVGNVARSQRMFDVAAAAVDADPTAYPSGLWVDETRVGSAMEVFPAQYGVPYLLVEMPGGMGEATYFPTPETRVHSYRVVLNSILNLFATELSTFTPSP